MKRQSSKPLLVLGLAMIVALTIVVVSYEVGALLLRWIGWLAFGIVLLGRGIAVIKSRGSGEQLV